MSASRINRLYVTLLCVVFIELNSFLTKCMCLDQGKSESIQTVGHLYNLMSKTEIYRKNLS